MIATGLHGTGWPWGPVPGWSSDNDLVENLFRRAISTATGERKMNNSYGSQVYAVIFENQGRAFDALVRREIRLAISSQLPMVNVLKIDIKYPDGDNKATVVIIDYEYLGSVGRMEDVIQ